MLSVSVAWRAGRLELEQTSVWRAEGAIPERRVNKPLLGDGGNCPSRLHSGPVLSEATRLGSAYSTCLAKASPTPDKGFLCMGPIAVNGAWVGILGQQSTQL